jgi:hypothetical protein
LFCCKCGCKWGFFFPVASRVAIDIFLVRCVVATKFYLLFSCKWGSN